MSLFNRKKNPATTTTVQNPSPLAEMALATINDGVIMTDSKGIIQYMNPAAASMTEAGSPNNAVGLDYGLFMKIEDKDGNEIPDNENIFIQSMQSGKPIEKLACCLVTRTSEKRIPIAISLVIANGGTSNRIITFRNITKELAEEGEQAEFISTASHEMRTPVASIEGYLGLALNPQTATIDERAKGYLESAHAASQHLGQLFRDLLDVTKLDDGHIKPHLEPIEMVSAVKKIADEHAARMREADLTYTFGTDGKKPLSKDKHRLAQVVYGNVDVNFLQEIVDNLVENAIKYTPAGGSVYVNVLGDGDRVLINVTDTGIGISSDDIHHVFQKFYRADNSDTRTIGGTGLGLYIVKKRVEAMGGRIWVESAFGEGSTFYVSLPRLTSAEYERLMAIAQNVKAMTMPAPTNSIPNQNVAPAMPVNSYQAVQPQPTPAPQPATVAQSVPAQPVVPIQPVNTVAPVAQPASVPTQPATVTPQTATPQPTPPPAPPVQPSPPAPQPPAPQPSPSNTNNVNNLNGGTQ